MLYAQFGSYVDPFADFSSAFLGDTRRSRAVAEVADNLFRAADKSLVTLGSTGVYSQALRVFNNKAIDYAVLESAMNEGTKKRSEGRVVLTAHDTTELSMTIYEDDVLREGFGRLSSRRQGLRLHTGLCMDAARGIPLGVAHMQPYVHRHEVRGQNADEWTRRGGLYDNEQDRWVEGIKKADDVGTHNIHLMDSEGSDYRILCELKERGISFVTRAKSEKKHTKDGKIESLIEKMTWMGERVIDLSKRLPKHGKGRSTRNKARHARKATLRYAARAVELSRTINAAHRPEEYLPMGLVVVQEVDPPAAVAQPVQWTLYTSLPIETKEQIETVIDYYKMRWVIEVFFKTLKTGFAVQKSQLQHIDRYLNFLAIQMNNAAKLLQLRYLDTIECRTLIFDELDLYVIKNDRRTKLPDQFTADDLLYALGAMGGHQRRRGPPGQITLRRGFEQLNTIKFFLKSTKQNVPEP